MQVTPKESLGSVRTDKGGADLLQKGRESVPGGTESQRLGSSSRHREDSSEKGPEAGRSMLL